MYFGDDERKSTVSDAQTIVSVVVTTTVRVSDPSSCEPQNVQTMTMILVRQGPPPDPFKDWYW